jgi:hypothetical protein
MTKTGRFEHDVRCGFYRWERTHYRLAKNRTFDQDFEAWLTEQGVPAHYVTNVVQAAAELGRVEDEEERLNIAYTLAKIFRP